jgi:Na+-driven multidrug efflux pump
VGQLGVLPLAALGPNAALFNVVFFVGFSALGVVATNQISAAYGADDAAAAGRGLIISSIVSIVMGAHHTHSDVREGSPACLQLRNVTSLFSTPRVFAMRRRETLHQSLIFTITCTGGAITALLLAAPVEALQLFQTNAEMMPYAKTYCVIR